MALGLHLLLRAHVQDLRAKREPDYHRIIAATQTLALKEHGTFLTVEQCESQVWLPTGKNGMTNNRWGNIKQLVNSAGRQLMGYASFTEACV